VCSIYVGLDVNRSTTDHIFCIHQKLEKKWVYNETVHQLFIDFKKAYDSVRREVLYNIIIESEVPSKLSVYGSTALPSALAAFSVS
jgi:hypothetical protein